MLSKFQLIDASKTCGQGVMCRIAIGDKNMLLSLQSLINIVNTFSKPEPDYIEFTIESFSPTKIDDSNFDEIIEKYK